MAMNNVSQSLKDQGKSRTRGIKFHRNAAPLSQSLKDQGKSRTEGGTSYYTIPSVSQSLKDQGKSRTKAAEISEEEAEGRNPLKIRASLGLCTAWHSHVDSRFHCANIRHKREEKVAGPKLIHIKSLLAF